MGFGLTSEGTAVCTHKILDLDVLGLKDAKYNTETQEI